MANSLRNRRATLFSVYVGNLHPDVTKEEVYKLFSTCGNVQDLVVMRLKEGQVCRFGFVRYGQPEEAVQAIKELNGWHLRSQRIVVDVGHDTNDRLKHHDSTKPPIKINGDDAAAMLPVENHLDSMKNLTRVLEACTVVSSDLDASGIMKVSRIHTALAKKDSALLARVPKPRKPQLALVDCFVKGQGETCNMDAQGEKTQCGVSVIAMLLNILQTSSPHQNDNIKNPLQGLQKSGASLKERVPLIDTTGTSTMASESSFIRPKSTSSSSYLSAKVPSRISDTSSVKQDIKKRNEEMLNSPPRDQESIQSLGRQALKKLLISKQRAELLKIPLTENVHTLDPKPKKNPLIGKQDKKTSPRKSPVIEDVWSSNQVELSLRADFASSWFSQVLDSDSSQDLETESSFSSLSPELCTLPFKKCTDTDIIEPEVSCDNSQTVTETLSSPDHYSSLEEEWKPGSPLPPSVQRSRLASLSASGRLPLKVPFMPIMIKTCNNKDRSDGSSYAGSLLSLH